VTSTHPITPLAWRKAQRCEAHGCVEVAETANGMAVRDSTIPDSVVLQFDGADWHHFLAGLRAGELSLPH
jgi:hypothetical protein